MEVEAGSEVDPGLAEEVGVVEVGVVVTGNKWEDSLSLEVQVNQTDLEILQRCSEVKVLLTGLESLKECLEVHVLAITEAVEDSIARTESFLEISTTETGTGTTPR